MFQAYLDASLQNGNGCGNHGFFADDGFNRKCRFKIFRKRHSVGHDRRFQGNEWLPIGKRISDFFAVIHLVVSSHFKFSGFPKEVLKILVGGPAKHSSRTPWFLPPSSNLPGLKSGQNPPLDFPKVLQHKVRPRHR